jgi:hypothetical protein
MGGILLESKMARLAVPGVLVGIFLMAIAYKFSQPIWALDQAIEAIRKFRACNVTFLDSEGIVFDCWAKAEPSGELSDELTLKGTNGAVIWVKKNKTYYYHPQAGKVEVDDAKTAGFSPWLGPELFKMISKADDARTVFGKDPNTGRDRVVMTGSMISAIGPISWSIEFDAETKLPVAYTHWNNLRRSGPPSISTLKIIYYEELPESFFAVEVPKNIAFVQRPIVLPEANLALLGNPSHGIPTEGLTRVEAARKILEELYKASMAGDLPTIRRLCPLTSLWSDELMRAIIVPEEEEKRLAEVVNLGVISREDSTRLGPIVIVPARLKTRDGRLWEDRQIVQFRQIDGRESCVVYGPYGMLSEVK